MGARRERGMTTDHRGDRWRGLKQRGKKLGSPKGSQKSMQKLEGERGKLQEIINHPNRMTFAEMPKLPQR